jgi:hypothetical protein
MWEFNMSRLIGAVVLFLATAGVAGATHIVGPTAIPLPAPEIDPASALSGLTLLLGGLAVVRGRRAKK